MNLNDAIIIDSKGIADGVLRDFKSPVEISSQSCFEIKPDGESEGMCLKIILERRTAWR
ncbi:MAG: hypothetical protein NPIRA05_12330 [Nitrospirales bacterium]|nr:MAG: hypothetical protein NPIRA05_12330 [Nitrospirales bacterium]